MKPGMRKDANGESMQLLGFHDSETIDGTSASAQSSVIDADDFSLVRIYGHSKIWVAVSSDPTAVAEGAGCFPIAEDGEAFIPVEAGEKVAVIGGKATISKCL